jgi:hypothetical protein
VELSDFVHIKKKENLSFYSILLTNVAFLCIIEGVTSKGANMDTLKEKIISMNYLLPGIITPILLPDTISQPTTTSTDGVCKEEAIRETGS